MHGLPPQIAERLRAYEQYVPLIVVLVTLVAIATIPLRVVGRGYLPRDDSLRHSAKAVSGKSWDQILVLRDEAKSDSHPGWHFILERVHEATKADVDSLVVFSVVVLFLLVAVTPVFFLHRKEAWPLAMLMFVATSAGSMGRFLLGRPFVLSVTVVMVICLTWRRFRGERTAPGWWALLIGVVAAASWSHATWYLYVLPLGCFVLAREWRACWKLAVCIGAGAILGILLTEHPLLMLKRSLFVMVNSPDQRILSRMLVAELQPHYGDVPAALAVAGVLLWRGVRGTWRRSVVDNPVFILAVAGYALGWFVGRFWYDWGFVAALIWTAREFEALLEEKMGFSSWGRVAVAGAAGVALVLSLTGDIGGRWTKNLTIEKIARSEASDEDRPWYPDPGGIVYAKIGDWGNVQHATW